MADNTPINLQAGGDTIATDELTTLNGAPSSGVKVQRAKLGVGDDGDLNDVSKTSPLPVLIEELLTLTRVQNGLLRAISLQLSLLSSPPALIEDVTVLLDRDGLS